MKNTIKNSLGALKSLFRGQTARVFCLSMQRTATTSVGKFFRDFGFRWAGWPASRDNDWSDSWYEGDYERIFSSLDFRTANAFEDSPWFLPGFYRVLFHRFPTSKFVLFTRDVDAWFESMSKHAGINSMGTRSRIHARAYRRELEYFGLLDANGSEEGSDRSVPAEIQMELSGHAEHYKSVYRLHSAEVQDFFRRNAPQALHVGTLEDPMKWQKLGEFLGIDVPADYLSHENASPT